VSPDRPIPLPVILGPTGSGKSALSLSIARDIGGEIVNFDSLQVYRGLDVGTAKTPAAERQGVPHHLIDIVEPTGLFTAGDYARAAEATVREISLRGHTAILVGGTGFYLRGLLEGLSPGPARDQNLRTRLLEREQKRPGSMHRILARLDPASSRRIHVNDKQKTIRALEVRILEAAPVATMFQRQRVALSGFLPVKIGLNPARELLYDKLNARARHMFHPNAPEQSLVYEVQRLLSAGVPVQAKPFESLGYKQVLEMLAGRITEEQAIESTQRETRNYAKRQLTWFRKEQNVHWIAGFGDEPRVEAEALAVVQNSIHI
jgi:tRNA dimethylallyltransferase